LESHERRFIFLPPIASEDGRSAASVRFWMPAALAVEGDHTIDDIPAVNASQGNDSASSFADDLRHSQTGTAGTLHDILLGYTGVSCGTPFSWLPVTELGIVCAEAHMNNVG
jgi:hypothetical protein